MLDDGPAPQPTILLIDDDAISLELLATQLGLSGFAVETAEDGAAALQLLADGSYSPGLILLDAQMPGLCGLILIQALRARCTARIVLISASQPPQELRAAADSFLLKPFGAEDLSRLLPDLHAPSSPRPMRNGGETPAIEQPIEAFDEEDLFLDPNVLAQLRSMMPAAAVREILAALVADLDRRMEALEAAIAVGDAGQTRRIGHAIKGGAAIAGAAQLARIGAAIESGAPDNHAAGCSGSAERNQLDNASNRLADLRQASTNLRRMLDEGSFA
jgi:CheY-like chemotaxis protein